MKKAKVLKKIKQYAISSDLYDYEIMPLIKTIDFNWGYLSETIKLDALYGCGGWGCAFETIYPEYTAKLTIDPEEIRFYKELQLYPEATIFPKIGTIEKLKGDEDVYLVFRESATPIPEIDDMNLYYELIRTLDRKNVYENRMYPYSGIDKVNNFISECHRLKGKENGIVVEDINTMNIGLSTVDGRIIIFDGRVFKEED